MCFCLAQPVMLASLHLGEGRRSSAAIAGPGTGAACWALPTQEGLCTARMLCCQWGWNCWTERHFEHGLCAFLVKDRKHELFFIRHPSLPPIPLHMQPHRWLRLARRSKMKGCIGYFHMSQCTCALCWPHGDSSSEPQSSKAEVVPETITAGSQHRYGLAPTRQYRSQDAGKHGHVSVFFSHCWCRSWSLKYFCFQWARVPVSQRN